MAEYSQNQGEDTAQDQEPDRSKYSLGKPAKDIYTQLERYRETVLDNGRIMSELTIPSLVPPRGWKPGARIPGNNQSIGARCVNTLAASLLFMAFPPNQPIMRFEPIEYELQAEISQNPELWGQIELSLSRLAETHRTRAMATSMESAYEHAMKLLEVSGHCLWKHININSPTVWDIRHYVCARDSEGNPLLTIHKETVSVATLDNDIREMIYRKSPEIQGKNLWEQECDIYSVCRLVTGEGDTDLDKHWEYWQEYEGECISETEVDADFDAPPMMPLWMIPMYGENWGRAYCDDYRGDLFVAESLSSSILDAAALASWSLAFVDPAGRSSLKQIREARNMSVFSGKATDISVFKADKNADLQFVGSVLDKVEKRLAQAFLLDFVLQRDGERVTAEEIRRLGGALDKALGGLYSEIAQRIQRPIIMRFIALHEEENPRLPRVPDKLVTVRVITGVDALGNSKEAQDLEDLGALVDKTFPQQSQNILNGPGFAQRWAAARGIKPDGIINTQQQIDARQQAEQVGNMRQSAVEQGAGPAITGMMNGLVQNGVPQAPQAPSPITPGTPNT